MRKTLLVFTLLVLVLFAIKIYRPSSILSTGHKSPESASSASLEPMEALHEISDVVSRGETFFDIFKRYGLDFAELHYISEASAAAFDLRRIASGRKYSIVYDDDNRVRSLTYSIDDDRYLFIKREGEGFEAEKKEVQYEKRVGHVGGTVADNLVSSMDDLLLALELSDIFAWDIDFTTDIRKGDTYKLVVEELWLDGKFKKYGSILSAEFVNNGATYAAYRFEQDGRADYFDAKGNSLRRAFLKAPLSYRRISSGYARSRFHPVLRIYRPHHGVDYSAPTGTPVSAVGDGSVVFAGYKGQNGRMVAIRHPNRYQTYYGHLSRIARGIRPGVKVRQGQVIGYVGSTGLATGPHLHFAMKLDDRFVNPLKVDMPPGQAVKDSLMADFQALKARMDESLASIQVFAGAERPGHEG
ncbi:MAG: M23 family metallopeptidase [Thermodesulfovibrionales bacterium]